MTGKTELYQATLDALSVHIALLDGDGTIVATNEAWRRFARENGDPTLAHTDVGVDYLDVCRRCEPDATDYDEAQESLHGIRAVLTREEASFFMEYPCHSPDQHRWFLMYATPISTSDLAGAVVPHVNITSRKLLEIDLQAAEARYRDLFEHVPVGLYRTTPDGQIHDVNGSMLEMLGYDDREASLAQNARSFYVDPEDRERWARLMDEAGEIQGFETRLRRQDGAIIWVRDSAHAVRDAAGRVRHYEGSWEEITQRKRYEAQLAHLANHDPLTSLLNRRRFEDEVRSHLAHAERYDTHGALLWIDLDGFKAINDRFGHQAGDRVLIDLARILLENSRASDVVGRLGGDEFAVLLLNVDAERAQAYAERLLERIRTQMTLSGQASKLAASIGMALVPQHGRRMDDLLVRADMAMYQAKDAGGGRVKVYQSASKR